MCMDCPEQQDGATVERWRILKYLTATLCPPTIDMSNEPVELNVYDILKTIAEMPEPTNEDAEAYYAEVNDQ